MNEIAAQFYHEPLADFDQLDTTQRQILNVLKLNEEALSTNELDLLRQLEERLPRVYGNSNGSGLGGYQEGEKVQIGQKRPAPDIKHEEEEQKEPKEQIPFLSQVFYSIKKF